MKYAIAALAFAAYASAQSVSACDGKAQPCLDDAMKTSGICEVGDWACGCENADTIQGAAATCVIAACGGATGALAVLEEVKSICASLPAEPTEPVPTSSEAPEEPEPTSTETPEETETASSTMSTVVTPTPTSCDKCEGGEETSTEAPTTTPTFVEAGAGAVAPMAALAFGLVALAL